MSNHSYVYCLTNDSMPNLVKIGMTEKPVEQRMKELQSTGVPTPFNLQFACRTEKDKSKIVEDALHEAFAPYRIGNREFFEIQPSQACCLLRLLDETDDFTEYNEGLKKQVEENMDPEDKHAREKLRRKRRRNFDFHEMGIANDSTLYPLFEGDCVDVVGRKEVQWGDKRGSLSKITIEMRGGSSLASPLSYWETECGVPLIEMYEEWVDPLDA